MLVEEIDESGGRGRAAHQGPEVDGSDRARWPAAGATVGDRVSSSTPWVTGSTWAPTWSPATGRETHVGAPSDASPTHRCRPRPPLERAERADRLPARAGAGVRLDAARPPGRPGLALAHRPWSSRSRSDRPLDGHLARKHNIVTKFGKLADPIADKALTGMAFIGLSILGELWWWVTIVILVREWGITLLRFVVLRYGVMAAGRGGKIKTVLQAVAADPVPAAAARLGASRSPGW